MNKRKEALKESHQVTNLLGELHNFLDELFQLKAGEMFRIKLTTESVIALKIPDYFNHITHPMDLITIKEKLNSQKYKYASEIEDDLNLMFNNCFLYNANIQKVLTLAKKFKESVNSRFSKLKSSIELSGLSFNDELNYNVSFQLKGEQRYEKEHEQVLNKLTQMIKDLYNLASAAHFRHKITDDYLIAAKIPQYKMIIKHPMDLVTIAEKFIARKYRTVSDLISDFYLMIDNFFEFNKKNDVLLKTGSKFKSAFEKRWKKISHFLQGSIIKDKTPVDYKAAKFSLSLEDLLQKQKESNNSISLEPESSMQDSIFNEEGATRNFQNFCESMGQVSESSRDKFEPSSLSSSNQFNAPPANTIISQGCIPFNFQHSSFSSRITSSNKRVCEINLAPLQKTSPPEVEKEQISKNLCMDIEKPRDFMDIENKWKFPSAQTPNKTQIKTDLPHEMESQNSRNIEINDNMSNVLEDVGSGFNKVPGEIRFNDFSEKDRLFKEISLTESVLIPMKESRNGNIEMDVEKKFEMSNSKHSIQTSKQNGSFEVPEAKIFRSSQFTTSDKLNAESNGIRENKSSFQHLSSNTSILKSSFRSELQTSEMEPEFGYPKQETPNFYAPLGFFDRHIEDEDRVIKLRKNDIERAQRELLTVKIEKYKSKLSKYIRKLIYLVNKEVKAENREFEALKDDISQMNKHDTINNSQLLLFLSFILTILEHQTKKTPNTINERRIEQLLKLLNKLRILLEKYFEVINFQFKPEETVQYNEKRRKFRRQIEKENIKPQEIGAEPSENVLLKVPSVTKEKSIDEKVATKITLPASILGNLLSTTPRPVKRKEDLESVKAKKAIEEYISRLKSSYDRLSTPAELKIDDKKDSQLTLENEKMTIIYEKEQPLTAECTMVEDNYTSPIFEQQICFSIKKPTKHLAHKCENSELLKLFSIEDQDLAKKKSNALDSARKNFEKSQKLQQKKTQEGNVSYKPWNHGLEEGSQIIPGENNLMTFNTTIISGKIEFNIRDYCQMEFINFCTVWDTEATIYCGKSPLDQKKIQGWNISNIKVITRDYENLITRKYPYSKLNILRLLFKVNLRIVDKEVDKMLLVTGSKVKFMIGNVLSNGTVNEFMNLQRNLSEEEHNLFQSSKLLPHEQVAHNFEERNALDKTITLLELRKLRKMESNCAYTGMEKLNQEGTQLQGIIVVAFDDVNNLSIDIAMGLSKSSKLI